MSLIPVTRKYGNCDVLQVRTADVAPAVLGFNYEAHNGKAYKINNSARDIFAISNDIQCFGRIFCEHAQTAIFELPVKSLISSLYSATPMS